MLHPRRHGRDLTHPGYDRRKRPGGATPYLNWGSTLPASTFVGSGTSTGPMPWPSTTENETCFILISFSNTDATLTLSEIASDLGTTRQSNGSDWHTEFYGTTFGPSPDPTLAVTFSESTDYIVTLAHGGALSGFDFATLQANGSSTSAANAGGTVVAATACIFIAHRKGANTTWTEPAGYTDNGESDSSPLEAHEAFLIAPGAGATGTVTATMGAAAKSATVLVAAS